jgi:hypothetical protein
VYQHEWFERYKAAILETDTERMEGRIQAAEKAIAERLAMDWDVPAEEQLALRDSQEALQALKKEIAQRRADLDRN